MSTAENTAVPEQELPVLTLLLNEASSMVNLIASTSDRYRQLLASAEALGSGQPLAQASLHLPEIGLLPLSEAACTAAREPLIAVLHAQLDVMGNQIADLWASLHDISTKATAHIEQQRIEQAAG